MCLFFYAIASSFVSALQRERERENQYFLVNLNPTPLTFSDRSMLEALGSPGERSILSEKKRRTGTGDTEDGKQANFLQEEWQAGKDSHEKTERRAEESAEADERSGREEDGEKRADSAERSKEEKEGQLTRTLSNC